MTWPGQVRSVFVKDMSQVWWMVALLIAAMVMTVARVTIAQPEVNGSFGWYDTLIPVLIMWIVSAVVRADPPGVSTAFWSTQPLEPSAVIAAKLLQVALVGVMAVGGAAVALRWWGIGWTEVPGTVVVTGIGAVTVAMVATLFATMNADVRGVLFGFVLTLGVFTVIGYLWQGWRPDGGWGRLAWLAMVVADVAAVASVYRRREVSLPWRAAGGALLALTILAAVAARAPSPYPVAAGAVAPPLSLTIDATPGEGNTFAVKLVGLVSPAEEVQVLDATLRVELPDGASVVLPVLGTGSGFTRADALLAQPPQDAVPRDRQWTLRASSPVASISEWSRLQEAGARVTFDGTIVEYVMKEQLRAPLASGVLPSIRPGLHQELRVVAGDTAKLAVVTSRWFTDHRRRVSYTVDDKSREQKFALVERATGTRILFPQSSGSGRGQVEALPGISIDDNRSELGLPAVMRQRASDTSWWSGYDIVISAPAVRRAYRVRAESIVGR